MPSPYHAQPLPTRHRVILSPTMWLAIGAAATWLGGAFVFGSAPGRLLDGGLSATALPSEATPTRSLSLGSFESHSGFAPFSFVTTLDIDDSGSFQSKTVSRVGWLTWEIDSARGSVETVGNQLSLNAAGRAARYVLIAIHDDGFALADDGGLTYGRTFVRIPRAMATSPSASPAL